MAGVAKVTFNGETLIDVTDKTVTANKMLTTGTALSRSGDNITGNIASKTSDNVTVSGATVSVQAGYYGSAVSKSVASMTLPTSASSTSSGTSKATISRSTSNQYINIPTGYNGDASYYTISAVANGTATAPASISGTGASVSTGTNTLTLSSTVSVTPTVSTAGYIAVGTAGNSSVSLTASVPTQAATTVTPSTSSQTAVSAGTYCTGAITVGAIPSEYIIPSGTKTITASGTTDVTAYASASVTGITLPTSASTTVPSLGVIDATIDASTSDQYLTIQRGFNDARFSYKLSRMPIGTAGTPSATKGTVSNNSVTITPSVTNRTGYITGSTETGTAVTVTASELVSGTKSITANATGIDVTNYAAVDVAVGSTINNQNKTVTPSTSQQTITADSGYTGLGVVTVDAMPEGEEGTPLRTITKLPLTNPTSFNIRLGSNPIVGDFVPGYFDSISYATSLTIENKSVIPSTTAQEITPTGNGYYLDKVTVAAMPSMTLPSSTSSSSSGTQKAVIAPSNSTRYLNIGTGYNSSSAFYKIDPSLAYEEGTFTPASDVARPTISFSNTHSAPPAYACIFDTSSASTQTADSISYVIYSDPYRMFGGGTFAYGGSDRYATVTAAFKTSTGGNAFVGFMDYSSDDSGDSTKAYSRYWVTESTFRPWANSDSRYFRSGRTYKWMAVWR